MIRSANLELQQVTHTVSAVKPLGPELGYYNLVAGGALRTVLSCRLDHWRFCFDPVHSPKLGTMLVCRQLSGQDHVWVWYVNTVNILYTSLIN